MTNPNDATPSEHYERFRAAYPAIADAHAALGQAIRAEGLLDALEPRRPLAPIDPGHARDIDGCVPEVLRARDLGPVAARLRVDDRCLGPLQRLVGELDRVLGLLRDHTRACSQCVT